MLFGVAVFQSSSADDDSYKFNGMDLLHLKKYILGSGGLSELQKVLYDFNFDGKYNGMDLLLMKKIILGIDVPIVTATSGTENTQTTTENMQITTKDDTMITMIPSLLPNEYQKEQIARKYGMFIHYGLNTFTETEWTDGTLPVTTYNPTAIDVDSWVKTAYEAGMTYVLALAKHHEGFCMWHTDTTNYSVKDSPKKDDVIKLYADACEKYGIKLALYYSIWDRHEPTYKSDFSGKYIDYMLTHFTELLDGRYGEIVELWFDGAWDKPRSEWQFERIYDHVKRLQPGCQIGINHTIGKDDNKTGMAFEGSGWPIPANHPYIPANYVENMSFRYYPSDFRLLDPFLPKKNDPKIYMFGGERYYTPFEVTLCIRGTRAMGPSDHYFPGQWFYSNDYPSKTLIDKQYVADTYRYLVADDNLLVVNLPPDRNGKLIPGDVARLFEIADELGIRKTWNN